MADMIDRGKLLEQIKGSLPYRARMSGCEQVVKMIEVFPAEEGRGMTLVAEKKALKEKEANNYAD